MNSIYHTELLAPSAVPFPVCGKYASTSYALGVEWMFFSNLKMT